MDSTNDTVRKYRELLGLHNWHINYVDTENGKDSNFHKESKPIAARAKIASINIGNVELEIIEPQDKESVYIQFLREKGPGIHHVMFATPNHDNCAERMAANNIAISVG